MYKKAFGILITVYAILTLLATPLESRFMMHVGELDFSMTLLDMSILFTKQQHIMGFGILSLLVLNYLFYDKGKYLKVFIGVFGLSVVAEVIQIFFVEGHFRLRDLISNIVGIVIAFGFFKIFQRHLAEASPKKTAFVNIIMSVMLVIVTLCIYYVFKEISVMLGGEELRKYL